MGLQVNEKKTEYKEVIVMERRYGMAGFSHLKIGSYEFRRAKHFKYLG